MKTILATAMATASLVVCSCSTTIPTQTYHATDSTAFVIESLDSRTSRILQPTPSGNIANEQILNTAKLISQHQTAVIILENYTETQVGDQFRDRATPWFVSLRSLGFDHIVFLQGNGNNNPEGLLELARYD